MPRRSGAASQRVHAVIKNYGIMWRRDFIFWGGSKQKGALLGRSSSRVVDFRDQVGVYVLYDETRRPIYVGQAGQGNQRLFVRLRAHRRDHLAHRWHYFSWFGLLAVNRVGGRLSGRDDPAKRVKGTLQSTLNEIEGVLIAATEPSFNKQGARFRGITRYGQVKHENADAVSSVEIFDLIHDVRDEVLKRLEKITASPGRKSRKAPKVA